ncbi:MAG: hypothetical protein WCE63_15975 [Acidobacteriaceae bacterium]
MICPSRRTGEVRRRQIILCLFSHSLLLGAMFLLWGCGATHTAPPAPPVNTPLSITQQPQDSSTPLGQTATFSVSAVGAGTLSYQWSENGTAITGATGASYTTQAVTPDDTGSKFVVTVQDGSADVTSNPATLTVGPRSPAAGDLRFQLVDSPATANGIASWTYQCCMQYPWGYGYSNSVGTPLRIGGGICGTGGKQNCAWPYSTGSAPAGTSLSIFYKTDMPEHLNEDLQSWITPNTVITSLDIEASEDVFAMSFIQDAAGGGFDYRLETATVNGLPALVALDGTQSRVVTAISFNDATGQMNLLSYGWASDQTTVYDTNVLTASYGNIGPAATTLANAGYIITAFGGNPTDGYVLVGTRVHGDSMPRPILVFPPTPTSTSTVGYALVGQVFNTTYGDGSNYVTWLFEK